MIKQTLGLVLSASLLMAATNTADIPKAWQPGFERIRESDLRADLGFIASDATLGRMSLQAGDDVTAEWIAAEFAPIF